MTLASIDISCDISGEVASLPLPRAAARLVAGGRHPFYLDSLGQPLFAWLHVPNEEPTVNHGVVICPPIGFEQLHAHRSLRHLADRLAELGIPAIRFDWHGTGDSAGNDTDPDRVATWGANVRTAVRWMKDQLRCQHVSVIGLRMGAVLASLALQDEPIENLVLWAPLTIGRGFVRECSVIDLLSDAPVTSREPGEIEAVGFRMTSATAADLTKCCLLQARPACHRVLLAGHDDSQSDKRVVDHFNRLGIAVDQQTWPGVAEMLVEPHKSRVPEIAIQGITNWLRQQVEKKPGSISLVAEPSLPRAGLLHDSRPFQESACRISESPDLFGILSEPIQPPPDEQPTVVLLNAGAGYRIGPGRLNVEMARRLTAQGFRCLRLDLCGLGDSMTTQVERENDPYPATAFRDIQIALNHLRTQKGSRRFVLMGLCSGAYAAFQSAAQLTDPDLLECVMINPLTYYWREGMTIETAPTLAWIRERYYLSSAIQPAKWLKLLTGRSQIGIRGALRLVAQRLGLTTAARKTHARLAGSAVRDPAHPCTEDLTRDLKSAVAHNRQLSLFIATSDPGYRILMFQAGRQARKMLRSEKMTATFLEDADHTFSRQDARRKLIDAVSEQLCRRYRSVD